MTMLKIVKTLIFTCIVLLLSSLAYASDLYVSTSGSDLDDCSILTPCQTLVYAVSTATANDVIHVAAGSYNEANIQITQPLKILGDGSAVTTVTSSGLGSSGEIFNIDINSGTVVIDGLTLDFTGDYNGIKTNSLNSGYIILSNNTFIGDNNGPSGYDYGILTAAEDKAYLTITKNRFSNMQNNAILLDKQLGSSLVSYNNFSTVSNPIYVMTYDNLHITASQKILFNDFDMTGAGSSDVAIVINSAAASSTDLRGKIAGVEVSDNTIRNCAGSSGIVLRNDANTGTGLAGEISIPKVYRNKITGSGVTSTGIALNGYIKNAEIFNNSINGLNDCINLDYEYGGTSFYPASSKINFNNLTSCGNKALKSIVPSAVNAENNWWGTCNPNFTALIQGTADYTPWIGICIADESLVNCGFESLNITLNTSITSQTGIDEVIFSITINGVTQNRTASLGLNNKYFYKLLSTDLVGGSTVYWKVYAIDSYGYEFVDTTNQFYVIKSTALTVSPNVPNGNNNWYTIEPTFTLLRDTSLTGTIYYRWDSNPAITYTAPFDLDNISNPPKQHAGILDLHWWTNYSDPECSGKEPEHVDIFKVDLNSPLIVELEPAPGSVVYNNKMPRISAYLDEVFQSNSGINKSSIIFTVNDEIISLENLTLFDEQRGSDSTGFRGTTVLYQTATDLIVGLNTVSINVTDYSGRKNSTKWNFTIEMVPVFDWSIFKPSSGLNGSKRIFVDILTTASEPLSLIEWINLNDSRPIWKKLCTNCYDYGHYRSKSIVLNEGENNFTFRATDAYENVKNESFNIFVDSVLPKYSLTTPKKGSYSNGSLFSVKYSEENIKGIKLVFDTASGPIEFQNTTVCKKGNNQQYNFTNLDLSAYDGMPTMFWFELTDILRTVKSRTTSITIDTTAPDLKVFAPIDMQTYTRSVPFDVTAGETASIYYKLGNSDWKLLCDRCDDYGNSSSKMKTISAGTYDITIKAVDQAGNAKISDEKQITIKLR